MNQFSNTDQFKAFLKKESKRLNISITNVYNTFTARCFLERLSKYNDHTILIKGSSAEIAYLGRLVRAITDVDIAILGKLSDSIYLFNAALNNSVDDIFTFKMSEKTHQTKTGIYKIPLKANFDKIEQTLGTDIQENYSRLIEPKMMIMPTIFEGDKEFEILVPSFEEYLAEKLCIIVESNREDILNTRVKDFYDIYELHGGKYNPEKLTDYFVKMLKLRGKTSLNQIKTLNLNGDFIRKHNPIWESTRKKYDFIDQEIGLEGAVYYTRAVLREQLQKCGQEMSDNITPQYQKKLQKNR